MRFRTISDTYEPGRGTTTVATAEVRPGHTITRTTHENRMAGGHKGRAAMVDTFVEYECECGGRIVQATTVARALADLRHFESADEREAYQRDEAELLASIMRSLGGEATR